MNRNGLQCYFGDKLDNVFLRASSFKCRVNGQGASFNVNLLQNLLFYQYKILFSLPTCVDMTLLLMSKLFIITDERKMKKFVFSFIFSRSSLPSSLL